MATDTAFKADLEKEMKPSDASSVKTGEVSTGNPEYDRYLQLHAEFQAENGHSHRKFLRKRKCRC